VTGEPIKVLAGRFGPYIASGGVNANVPKSKEPADVTLEEAVALLAEREAKGGSKVKKKAPAKKAPAQKAAAKKTAAPKAAADKKPAAKKAAPKKAPAKKTPAATT
jgi:DNA topoisomerase-1